MNNAPCLAYLDVKVGRLKLSLDVARSGWDCAFQSSRKNEALSTHLIWLFEVKEGEDGGGEVAEAAA